MGLSRRSTPWETFTQLREVKKRGESTLKETVSIGLPRRSSPKSSFVKRKLKVRVEMLAKYVGGDEMRTWW